MRSNLHRKCAPLVFVVLVSIALSIPLFLYGPLPDGHDLYEHRNFIQHFREQFYAGDFYPRWLINMNHGLGSPTLFVFPPLPAYVCLAVTPLSKLIRVDPFTFSIFLPLVGSGVCAFFWLQPMFGKSVAALSACLYMLMPYHLVIDYYRRCAVPECWAFAWMPLILYFAKRLEERKANALIGLAIASALFIFSHVVSFVTFFPVAIGMAALDASSGKRLQAALRVGSGFVMGAGLAAIYLLPALENSRYIPASRLVSREFFQLPNQLLSVGLITVASADGWEHFLRLIILSAVSQIMLVCIAVAFAWNASMKGRMGNALFFLLVCISSFLLMLNSSLLLWKRLPLLHQLVQFPWRFNTILCLGTLWFTAVLLAQLFKSPHMRTPGLACFGLVVFAWLYGYASVWRHYGVAVPPGPANERHLISDNDGWLPAWLAPGTDQRSALLASTGSRLRFKEGTGGLELLRWEPRRIEFDVKAAGNALVMVNQFYYPTWRAQLANGARIPLGTALPEGLLEIPVQAGVNRIQIAIPISPTERAGRWISIVCLGLCVASTVRRTQKRKGNQSDAVTA